MKDIYRIKADSKTSTEQIYQEGNIRISVLTPMLLRIEWSTEGEFVDQISQVVWNRKFPKTDFSVKKENGITFLETEKISLSLSDGKNLSDSLRIVLRHPNNILKNSWRYGDRISTLGGTARTLDGADGCIPLEDGIVSRDGFTVLDDSDSCLIQEDGTLLPRKDPESVDIYFFGYGHEYKKCMHDYFVLTEFPPMLPKFAFGNWWSRYYKYTQDEYLELMDRFKKEDIPLSVAVIDMDWHLVDIDSSIGTGWTGYTWNKDYFPDHRKFLSELHERKLFVSLNVHPAEGIGCHEENYIAMKKALGESEDGKPVQFDIADPEFAEAYFSEIHHPLEDEGVDFWWIDWQQGNTSSRAGQDPLWLLNHYHYLDNLRRGKRSLILSRYAGPGSHRYPIGFSGDTVISWKSLEFQPYFTVTAANIGFGWWSHDIGGHMLGTYDEELQVRWAQWGVFSPVMRLHSSASPFNHKEPWNYSPEANRIIKKFMVLRQRLIPYLYTMSRRFSCEGIPLLEPMYWEYPESNEAYSVRNEYFFGSELISAPVSQKIDSELNLSEVKLWLPEGEFTDVFTGRTYTGDRMVSMYRKLSEFPLLLKAGGIVPLSSDEDSSSLELYVALGNDGSFVLYEDEGDGFGFMKGAFATTEISYSQKDRCLVIHASCGDLSFVPEKRKLKIHFMNCDFTETSGYDCRYDSMKRELVAEVTVSSGSDARIELSCEKIVTHQEERAFMLLDKMNIDFIRKDMIYSVIKKSLRKNTLYAELLETEKNVRVIKAVMEQLENR